MIQVEDRTSDSSGRVARSGGLAVLDLNRELGAEQSGWIEKDAVDSPSNFENVYAMSDIFVLSNEPWSASFARNLSTSGSYSVAFEGWAKYFAPSTTLTVTSYEPSRSRSRFVPVTSAAERLRDVIRHFSLRKTDLKDVCGVSRQTVYDWLEGKFEPDGDNASRVRDVHELALLVAGTGFPLRAAVLTQPLVGETSFLDLLRAPRLDMPSLRQAIETLATRSAGRELRSARETLKRLAFAQTDGSHEARNLDHNLRGFPGK